MTYSIFLTMPEHPILPPWRLRTRLQHSPINTCHFTHNTHIRTPDHSLNQNSWVGVVLGRILYHFNSTVYHLT